ncbi:MAG: HNH endonuclease signature motif containing protein [Acidimicrobiia bacterium]
MATAACPWLRAARNRKGGGDGYRRWTRRRGPGTGPCRPTHIRRALVVRDSGCAWPGCDRPPLQGNLNAHHIVHWAHGGTTSTENCVLLGRTHHSRVHEHRWSVKLTTDGRLEVKPP